MIKQSLYSWCFMVTTEGGVGRFAPMVVVVERVDAADALSFSNTVGS